VELCEISVFLRVIFSFTELHRVATKKHEGKSIQKFNPVVLVLLPTSEM